MTAPTSEQVVPWTPTAQFVTDEEDDCAAQRFRAGRPPEQAQGTFSERNKVMSTIPEQYRQQAEVLESIDLDVLQANVARAIFEAGAALRAAASDIEARDEGMEGLAEARDRLRAVIGNAPHAEDCSHGQLEMFTHAPLPCTCWKAEAL